MTNTELKTKLSEVTDQEWFKNVEVIFNFKYVGFVQTLKGVSAIYEFVNQQISGWEKIENLPSELDQSKAYFTNVKKQITQFVNNYFNQSGNNLNSYWASTKNTISTVNSKPLPYNIPQVEFLLKVHRKAPPSFQGAYNFILGTNNYNLTNREYLYGALMAYEFTFKDHTEITDRREAEEKSISTIRNDFQNYLTESEKHISEHLSNANLQYSEYVKSIDKFKKDKEDLFTKWFDNTKTEEWEKWFEPSKKKIGELEQTYQAQLKLKEPAKYWSDRAKALKKQGWIAMSLIIVLVGLTCWSLGEILWRTPEQIYLSWFKMDKSAAIRWSIVYITLISFIAYCIRALTKVMFSSFHLARDCEERHTLTYFYLSLLKDSKVDEKDRQLIMQSLFSRAETGLLREDSSPTMPNDTFKKFIST